MRKIIMGILLVVVLLITTSCTSLRENSEKSKELDFTVANYNNVPKEVQNIIDEKKEKPFKTTFSDMENTYIIIGYGQKQSEGYSIKINELYESDTNVYVKTTFNGPDSVDGRGVVTYPYIIIQVEYTGKTVKVIE